MYVIFDINKISRERFVNGLFYRCSNRICGVMVSVLVFSAVDHGFQLRSGKT
jgi:hypothetical protein